MRTTPVLEAVTKRIRRLDLWMLALGAVGTLLTVLVVSPLFWLFWQAAEVELGRAIELLFSTTTGRTTLNSIVLTVAVTAFSIAIGVPLAVATTRTDLPYARFWTIVAALPLVVPSYIGAIAFVSMFGSGGEVDTLFGVAVPRVDGLSGAVFIITLYTYPYVFLTTRAALLSMDSSLLDAARTLNHSSRAAFRRVTAPIIRPGVAAGALLVALYAISDFGTPAFMQADVFTARIYGEFSGFAVEYAALLAIQLITIVAVILVIEAGIGHDEEVRSGTARGPTIRLGRWRWPTMGAIGVLGGLTLVVPVTIFGIWLVRGEGDPIPALEVEWTNVLGGLPIAVPEWLVLPVPVAAANSVYLAGLAAVGACVVALPVAYYSGRTNTVFARILERATYVGFAVPGVVIGLALVFVGTRTLPSLYRQGVWLLVFGYIIRFLPQAVGAVRSSVLQVDETTLEAARTLNAGRIERFRRVTTPLIMPGIVAGAVLVFLTTMKELPMTLMLAPIGMDTLVMRVWEANEAFAYRYAAIPALLLVLISGVTMLVLLRQEGRGV